MRMQIAVLLITSLIAGQPTVAFSQRGRQPLRNVGVVPEQSVQSILLIYLGRNLSVAKANELENELRKNPDKISERLTLIGYYGWSGKNTADRQRLRTHVLWIIENHPEHPASSEQSLRDLPDDPEGNLQILALWNRNLESRGEETEVLKNAERFFFSKDPQKAERIIYRLADREPTNRQWPAEMAKLYAMFGVPGSAVDDPSEKTLEAYKRVLALTRDSSARQALAGEMADSAFKTGNLQGAAALAKVHLQGSDRSAVQRANTLLGRVALRLGDPDKARGHLLASAQPETADYVAVFGPTMVLARELLDKGERDVVLEYLDNCIRLWPNGEPTLRFWIADIKNGKKPDFGSLGM